MRADSSIEKSGGTLGPLTRNHANILGLGFLHLAALAAPFYLGFVQFYWGTLLLGLIWYGMCCLGITAGYHRSFCHRAYDVSGPLRWFYLLFGAAAMQTSALEWCADHRDHHSYTDGQKDPHSIKEGFFWAHMGWILNKRADRPEVDYSRVKDLAQQRGFRFQKRFFWPLAIGIGWILPALIASLWGDFVGGLLLAGGLRVTVMLHATWCVNSVAHVLGKRTYSLAISARDSLITALITGGEGYHNFHHKFPADYRNAVRWYQYDPTKWFIWTMARLGLAYNLRRTTPQVVLAARERVRSLV